MRQDETVAGARAIAAGQGADLAAFYDRRAAAALAYCSRLCAPEAIADAVEVSFARVFESVAAGEAGDEAALDRRLRSAVRAEAASRASAATAGMPARRLLERLADPTRGGACELMPALLAARADGVLSDGDRERMQAHLRRCAECRTAEHRFEEAERAFEALAGDQAPALGRSLLAEMLSDAPLGERRRFTRERLAAEPPDWLEEVEWEDDAVAAPRVIQVPGDALDSVLDDDGWHADHDEPEAEEAPAADDADGDEADAGEPAEDDARLERETPEPAIARDPEVTSAQTAGFPAVTRTRLRLGSIVSLSSKARRRLAIAMLVVGLLLLAEAGLTVAWKEPFTAYLAARSQDDLTGQLRKLSSAQSVGAADEHRIASIGSLDARAKARMAVLAKHERETVPEGDALGTLRIARLGLDDVIVQGEDAATLRKGPAHYRTTPLPGENAAGQHGAPGAVGIAGHRTTYGGPFRRIDELKPGDTITLKMPYGIFNYVVDRQRIVPADYGDAFKVSGEQLVLSACHPLYSASERILVYAHLVSAQPLGAAAVDGEAGSNPATDARLAAQRKAARLRRLGKRTLVAGMTGPDVKELQRLLGLPPTGTFGPDTRAAVLQFQREHGLPQVGNAGSQTKAALARREHPPSRPPTPPDVPQQRQPDSTGQQGANGTGGTGTTPQGGTATQPQSGTSAQPPSGQTGR